MLYVVCAKLGCQIVVDATVMLVPVVGPFGKAGNWGINNVVRRKWVW